MLSLYTPAVGHGRGLVVEVVATLEDAALIVEHVVAQGVVEAHVERQVLPRDVSEDVAIDVRVGIADDGHVGLTNLAIAIDVLVGHIACAEVLAGTRLVDQVEIAALTGSLRIGIGGEDTLGAIAIEHAHGLAHDGGNVVGAIDGGGESLGRKCAVDIDLTVVGQRLHLVDIVTHTCTKLDVEVTRDDGLARDGQFEARVVERAAIAPVVVDTGHGVLKALQGEQVAGVVHEVVEVNAQTVVQQVGLEADVHLAGLLPADFLVADVVELGSRRLIQVLGDAERRAGRIVVDVVVAAEVEASLYEQVVDGLRLGEPSLVGKCPT